MASVAQIAANRRNSKKSTGPKTCRGKAASSKNALKHGLTSQACLLPGEDPFVFDAFRSRIIAEIQPNGVLAELKTERLVELLWRLRRVVAFETNLFSWLAHQQAQINDGHDVREPCRMDVGNARNGNEILPQKNSLMSPDLATGRCFEEMLERDLTCKLSRYEAHLARQVECVLFELRPRGQ